MCTRRFSLLPTLRIATILVCTCFKWKTKKKRKYYPTSWFWIFFPEIRIQFFAHSVSSVQFRQAMKIRKCDPIELELIGLAIKPNMYKGIGELNWPMRNRMWIHNSHWAIAFNSIAITVIRPTGSTEQSEHVSWNNFIINWHTWAFLPLSHSSQIFCANWNSSNWIVAFFPKLANMRRRATVSCLLQRVNGRHSNT